MTSNGAPTALHSDQRSPAQDIPSRVTADAPSRSPVEMNSLQNDGTTANTLEQSETHRTTSDSDMRHRPMRTDTSTALQSAQNPPSPPPPLPALPAKNRDRAESTAIGPSLDSPAKDAEATGPTLMLNLLLLNGARHPFNLDAAYLARRNVQAQNNDPYNLSVYKVKELILREWRSEWEAKPSSPSAIRLIHLGKVLDDKTAFKDLKFQQKASNVVHMSIKPQDFMEDEDAKGAKATRSQSHDGTEGRSPGCRCLVM